MTDKVSELRNMLKKQKKSEKLEEHPEDPKLEQHVADEASLEDLDAIAEADTAPEDDDEPTEKVSAVSQIDELKKANEIQKDMYLKKVAEFENFRKRLQKEQDEFNKYANEKILEEMIPVIDSLEMTLSHAKDDDKDPILEGVRLTLKQFLSVLEKFGVKEITGENEKYDPNLQEAIGSEEREGVASDTVVQVHRKGYQLNGKLIRAAMVTVSS
jgi:molecular chaperone GrpE